MRIAEYEREEIREIVADHQPMRLQELYMQTRHPRDRIRHIIKTDSQLKMETEAFTIVELADDPID